MDKTSVQRLAYSLHCVYNWLLVTVFIEYSIAAQIQISSAIGVSGLCSKICQLCYAAVLQYFTYYAQQFPYYAQNCACFIVNMLPCAAHRA